MLGPKEYAALGGDGVRYDCLGPAPYGICTHHFQRHHSMTLVFSAMLGFTHWQSAAF